MQKAKWAMQGKSTKRLVQAAIGIILLVLLIGLWACLWVPPSIF
jgi:4-amino-4-deoxy-L-arabinose transferase-like glycosyltransferase